MSHKTIEVARPRLILWDLDGTLIDSVGVVADILSEVLPTHGYALPTPDALAKNFHGSLLDTIDNLIEAGEPGAAEAVLESFLVAQNKHYESIEQHLFSDAIALAHRAHQVGVQQVLVTNRDHEGRGLASPRSIVERSVLQGLIGKVIAGDDSSYRKPNPAVLGGYLSEQGILPEQILVIGDQFVDAQFAHNLGINAVIVDRHGNGLVNADQLHDGWQDHTTVVNSLDGLGLV